MNKKEISFGSDFLRRNEEKSKTTEVNCFFTSDYNDTIRWLEETASKYALWFCFLSYNGIALRTSLSFSSSAQAFYTCDFNLYAHPSIGHPYTLDT